MLAASTIPCSTFRAEQVVLDEHRGLVADGGDELEVLLLELRERLGVEPHRTEHLLLVEEGHDDRARDAVQDSSTSPWRKRKSIEASWVSTAARSVVT